MRGRGQGYRRLIGLSAAALALGWFAAGRRSHSVAPAAGRPIPAFDVGKLAHDAHFAFRVDPASHQLEGGDLHYRVLVDERGALLRVYGDDDGASDPLRLTTTSIRRAHGAELADAAPRPSVAADGTARLEHVGVIETYRNDERGTEQQLHFAARPDGDGPLEVRVAVTGLAYRDTTDAGLHFVDTEHGLGVRYGVATFVDAQGERTPIPTRFADGSILLSVPAEVIERAAYPAVLDPIISPELEVDEPILGNAYGAQINPALAFDGTNFLVVFQDPRLAFAGASITAARIAPDGTVLDPVGFVVADTTSALSQPKLACTPQQRCIVACSDGALGGSRTVLVDTATAAPLPGTSRAIVIGGNAQTVEAVASDGASFVATWNEASGTNINVRGARIDGASGDVLDSTGFDIAVTSRTENSGGLTCAGTSCVVAWSDFNPATSTRALRFSRFSTAMTPTMTDAGGVVLDTSGALAPPQVALAGGVLAFAWPEDMSVLARRYSAADAQPLDGSATTALSSSYSTFSRVALAAGPGGVAIAGTCRINDDLYVPLNVGGRILLSVLDPVTGTVTPAGGADAPTGTSVSLLSTIALAADSTQFTLAFPSNDAQSTGEIIALRFTANGPTFLEPPVIVTHSANDERMPAVAAASDVFLVTWVDQRRGSVTGTGYEGVLWSDVYAARVRASDGVALDPIAIEVSTGAEYHGDPSVAFDGTRFLVTYYERVPCDACSPNYDVLGRRIDPATGELLDATPLAIATTPEVEREPSVCGAAGRFFVAYTQGRYVAGSVVDGATGAVGSQVQVSPAGPSFQSHGAVACAADASMAVWQDHTPWFGSPSTDVYARRFDLATGTFEDLPGRIVSVLGPSFERYPVITRIGQMFVIAWEDNREGTLHIYAARIGVTSGTLYDEDGIRVSANAVGQADVGIASDGLDAVIVFRDDGAAPSSDVELVRVGENGVVLDQPAIPIAASDTIEGEPVVASTPSGHMLVAYTRYVPEDPYASARIRARTVFYLRPNGKACTDDDDCGSSHCEDGVCCASSCGGSNPSDCRACSVAAGAFTDGTCGTVLDTSVVCRPSTGSCDVAETCDGASTACPVDVGGPCDAGVPDANVDAAPDAGPDADPDAALDATVDAAVPDAPTSEPAEDGGCGCAAPGSARSGLLLALAVVIALRRRRPVSA